MIYNMFSMRILSSSVMAVLIVVALLWGNCYSCPQLLLAQQSHECCHKTKTANIDCQWQSLQHFVKAGGTTVLAMPSQAAFSPPVDRVTALPTVREPRNLADSSPPDLLSFRI
jgi:hypothetical protein